MVEPAASAASTPGSSSPFIARPWRRIQNSIQVRTTTANDRGRPSSVSWTTSGSRPTVSATDDAGRDRQADGRDDADRDLRQRVRSTDLDEVGGDDADDERGLEAFAEHQEERGGHGSGRPRWRCSVRST